jgi:hypothetical protein
LKAISSSKERFHLSRATSDGLGTLSDVATQHPNPETVEALLDTTWRVADAEAARTDGLDRKLTSLATFASLLISVVAVLGGRLFERDDVPT